MRRLLDKFFPIGTKRRTFLFESKKNVKKFIAKLFEKLYTKIPLGVFKNISNRANNKTMYVKKNKDKLYPKKNEFIVYDKKNDSYYLSHAIKKMDKKIAVHVHLFYQDLLDEFVKYLNNIPFKFDIYCSTNKENDIKLIENKLNKIKNVNKVVVKATPNIGRDYAPMVCEFGKQLKKYNYICHIHTKKSLRTGVSQDGWRLHLLDGVLGNENIIRNIFDLFENDNIGVFFPDSHFSAPYWANTWMGAKQLGIKYLNELGIPFDDKYQDFSVGSMFWVREKAVHQIFDKNWKWEEFGEELGQDDGTLAYVFERLFVLCSKNNNFDFICYNPSTKIMQKGYSERNISQYYEKNIKYILEKAKNYDIISFDIFDTLLTRKIYNPDDIFNIIDKKKNIKLDDSFINIRKKAENTLRNEKNDPSIDEIYDNLMKQNKLSKKEMESLKELEINLEKEYLIPRKEVLNLYNEILKMGKKIILVSDMYLTSKILSEILEKNGYKNYEKLYVSCETNLRKDNGNIWNYIKNIYKNQSIMHIGDNEESDCHKLWSYNLYPEHIMSGKRMYENSSYGFKQNKNNLSSNISDSILYGLVINKTMFNNPFKWNETKGLFSITNLYEYGYSVIGPILLNYMVWLIKSLKSEKNMSLLFLAREGYYFQKMYNILKNRCDTPWLKNIDDIYFLTSRRCASVACIESKEDIYKILDTEYYGDLYSLLKTRFNLKVKESNFDVVINPDGSGNKDDVINIVNKYEDKIMEIANKEKINYLNYINKNVKFVKNSCVVDLGYSGTTQLYLSKLLKEKLSGKYLVVKNNPKPLSIGCKVESCYNTLNNDNNHPIYKNSLLLEFFLTAPYGQLQYIDDNGNPVYVNEKLLKEKMKYLDEIFDGVEKLFNDIIDLLGTNIDDYNFNIDNIVKNFEGFLDESNIFLANNRRIFEFEDYYCRKNIMVLEKIK